MTRIAKDPVSSASMIGEILDSYRAYLPNFIQRIHPYAAPLESRGLRGLPPAFIASVANDPLRIEAAQYAAALIATGVPTQAACYEGVTRTNVIDATNVVSDAIEFLQRRFSIG